MYPITPDVLVSGFAVLVITGGAASYCLAAELKCRSWQNYATDLMVRVKVLEAKDAARVRTLPALGVVSVPLSTVHPAWRGGTDQLPPARPVTYRDVRSRRWPQSLADLAPEPDPVPAPVPTVRPDESAGRRSPLTTARMRLASARSAFARWRVDRAARREAEQGWETPQAFAQLRSLADGVKHRSTEQAEDRGRGGRHRAADKAGAAA